MEPKNQQKNIVVIGGGPAGIEASRALDAMGYTVFLVERDSRLGGHLGRWDRLFPYGTPAEDVLSQLTASMGRIKWFTSTEVTQVNKLERADHRLHPFQRIQEGGIRLRHLRPGHHER